MKWEFRVPTSELKEAAATKAEHHRERQEYYAGEVARLREVYIASVQESAREAVEKEAAEAERFAENVAQMYGNGGAGYAGSSTLSIPQVTKKQIQGDPEKYNALNQALGKVEQHRNQADEYERWGKLLARDSESKWAPVTYDDAQFFGIA